MYLLLQRDAELFEKAKTTILNKDELWDSADSILWVYDAVDARYTDLKGLFGFDSVYLRLTAPSALFIQQKLDVDQQFKRVACEMVGKIPDPLLGCCC